MRQSMKLVLPVIAVSALIAACGGSSSSNSASSSATSQAAAAQNEGGSSTVVKTATSPSLHKVVLVNSQGMTLYALSAEQGGKFICTNSACEGVWHPLTVSAASTPTGTVSSLSVVKRPDGTTQVTYKGMPLYTFAQDHAAGEANGQGVKDVGTWNAVTASGEGGAAAAPSTSSSAPASEGSGGGGYGY
jgi:predicted lipoprotein with Yx(FWY)xxD motif